MASVHEVRNHARNRPWLASGFEFPDGKAVTASVTLTDGDSRLVELNASGGAFTVTLPAAPYEGMCWHFSEGAGSGNVVLIDGNGKNINGAATLTMNAAYMQRVIRYNGTQWIIIRAVL